MILFISSFFAFIGSFFGDQTPVTQTAVKHLTTVPNNDTFALAKFKGKVVILNFWASWSKSSRVENKNMVRIYQRYKTSSKIAFVSVSLDTDEISWKSAIDEDGLEWKNHFCDFKKYESPTVKNYKVNTLPVVCLFDKAGNLVKTVTKVSEIETSIDGLLN